MVKNGVAFEIGKYLLARTPPGRRATGAIARPAISQGRVLVLVVRLFLSFIFVLILVRVLISSLLFSAFRAFPADDPSQQTRS